MRKTNLFSKRQYEVIAGVLNQRYRLVSKRFDNFGLTERGPYFEVKGICFQFAEMFKKDNKNFDMERFMDACLNEKDND